MNVAAVVVSHGNAAELDVLVPALGPQVDELVVVANVPGSVGLVPEDVCVIANARPIGFELCGPANGSCRYADARVNGDTVEIASDGGPVARVRYAWADYPIVNLYDGDMLPAPVFEIAVQ